MRWPYIVAVRESMVQFGCRGTMRAGEYLYDRLCWAAVENLQNRPKSGNGMRAGLLLMHLQAWGRR